LRIIHRRGDWLAIELRRAFDRHVRLVTALDCLIDAVESERQRIAAGGLRTRTPQASPLALPASAAPTDWCWR